MFVLVRGFVAAVVVACAAAAGCSDFFDVDVDLPRQTFGADFGTTQGTVPSIPCDPAGPDSCAAGGGAALAAVLAGVKTPNVEVSAAALCDGGSERCYAQASATLSASVAVLQDDSLSTRIARNGLFLVRAVDLVYTAPENTLTFDVPAAAVYVGPPGTAHPTDTGVASAGSLVPLAAGTPLTSERHLVVQDGSPARALVEKSIRDRSPFVFLLVLTPRIDAGAPIPAGALEVDLVPHVIVGL